VNDRVLSFHSASEIGCLILQTVKRVRWVLTAEGKMYTIRGSPEVQVFTAVPAEGISAVDLKVCLHSCSYQLRILHSFFVKFH